MGPEVFSKLRCGTWTDNLYRHLRDLEHLSPTGSNPTTVRVTSCHGVAILMTSTASLPRQIRPEEQHPYT